MKPKNWKRAVGCDCAAMKVAAVKVSLKKEGLFGGVNYKTGGVILFPFFWFAFWWRVKMRETKRLLTKVSQMKGKENVIERANIDKGI